jgi:WD40 repeat protein
MRATIISGGEDGMVRVWRGSDPGHRTAALKGAHGGSGCGGISAMAVASDGASFVSGAKDGSVVVWEEQQQQPADHVAAAGGGGGTAEPASFVAIQEMRLAPPINTVHIHNNIVAAGGKSYDSGVDRGGGGRGRMSFSVLPPPAAYPLPSLKSNHCPFASLMILSFCPSL